MREKILHLWVLVVCCSGAAWADPIQIKIQKNESFGGKYELGVGSKISVASKAGVFLGELINLDGTFAKYMYLDSGAGKIYLASGEDISMPVRQVQAVLQQYDQVGGTCTGYAINNIFQEMVWAGIPGNGTLAQALSTEKGRTDFLVGAINEYYLTLQHRYSIEGVMKKIAEPYGYSCEKKMFQDSASAIQYLHRRLAEGYPVMIAFNIGPTMATAPFPIVNYDKHSDAQDDRLWLPRQIGQRNSGGHSTVAVAGFLANGREELLMLDSDWASPRVWDMETVFNQKTAIGEIEFHSCE